MQWLHKCDGKLLKIKDCSKIMKRKQPIKCLRYNKMQFSSITIPPCKNWNCDRCVLGKVLDLINLYQDL